MNTPFKEHSTIHIISDSIINSLGFSTDEVFQKIKNGESGSKSVPNFTLSEPTAMLSCINNEDFIKISNKKGLSSVFEKFTFFEQLMVLSIKLALEKTDIDVTSNEVLFVFSTTKGNIGLLDQSQQHLFDPERVHIWKSIELITQYFKNPNQSMIISNACISGTQSILVAKNVLATSNYKYIIVCGADTISPFIVSGFQSFKALSPEICKPFDLNRQGLNIGEGVGTMILSKNNPDSVSIVAGAVTNDANHISGPSRTGEGLFRAITKSIQHIDTSEISFINAHGTATPYNDEMEAIAFDRASISEIPINSFKANFGHTLGAAGIIETILSAYSLQNGVILPSLGYDECGVSIPLNISKELGPSDKKYCLKTASGFGGCNVALLLQKGGTQ
jgi:3-oxoacyl-[acyl-carrier-protein] synthase I